MGAENYCPSRSRLFRDLERGSIAISGCEASVPDVCIVQYYYSCTLMSKTILQDITDPITGEPRYPLEGSSSVEG